MLDVGNFQFQSVEVFKMHFTWFIVYSLMCECTEGCCKVCTECTVPVEVVDHPRKDLIVSLSVGNSI